MDALSKATLITQMAMMYWAQAADNGCAASAMRLALGYRYGLGVVANAQREYDWLLKARNLNCREAIDRLHALEKEPTGKKMTWVLRY